MDQYPDVRVSDGSYVVVLSDLFHSRGYIAPARGLNPQNLALAHGEDVDESEQVFLDEYTRNRLLGHLSKITELSKMLQGSLSRARHGVPLSS